MCASSLRAQSLASSVDAILESVLDDDRFKRVLLRFQHLDQRSVESRDAVWV